MNRLTKILFIFSVVSGLVLSVHTNPAHAKITEKNIRVFIKDRDVGDAWLGIKIRDLDKDLRKKLDTNARYGAVVDNVLDDTPAEAAGIEPGDVIVKFGSKTIHRSRDLTKEIAAHKPGDEVEVEIIRGQERKKVTVELGERPHDEAGAIVPKLEILGGPFETDFYLGMTVQEMDEDLASYFHVEPDDGLLITAVDEGSPAEKAGLKSGDVLLEFDGKKVNKSEDIAEVLENYEEGDEIDLKYLRKGNEEKTTITLEYGPEHGAFRFRGRVPWPDYYVSPWRSREYRRKFLDDMRLFRERMGEWRNAYRNEMRDRIRKEVERAERKRERSIKRLQEELEKLKDEMDRLRKEISSK